MDGIYLSYLRVNRGDNGGYLAGLSAPSGEGRECGGACLVRGRVGVAGPVSDQEVPYLKRGDSTREHRVRDRLRALQRATNDHRPWRIRPKSNWQKDGARLASIVSHSLSVIQNRLSYSCDDSSVPWIKSRIRTTCGLAVMSRVVMTKEVSTIRLQVELQQSSIGRHANIARDLRPWHPGSFIICSIRQ